MCAIKNTKKLRRGAVLSCQRIRRSPKTVRTCAKRRTYFLFFLRIDVAAGGGYNKSNRPEGFGLDVRYLFDKKEEKKMKLFKKLAAAVLVAALALTMVGCGGRNSLTDQIKDVIADFYAMEDKDVTNKKELDALAAKLMAEADKAAAKAENKGKTVLELLIDEEVVKAAGINAAKETYRVSAVENYKLLSSTVSKEKALLFALELTDSENEQIGSGVLNPNSYGLAMGKINGKEYFVMLMNGQSRL